jgi:hypothetical protein
VAGEERLDVLVLQKCQAPTGISNAQFALQCRSQASLDLNSTHAFRRELNPIKKKKLQDFLAPCFEAGRYNMGGASEFSQIFTKSGFQRATRALAIGQGPLGRGQELISGTRGITQRLG